METSNVTGKIPKIVKNDENTVYLGNLKHYFNCIFYNAKNLNNPYHNFRHMCHVLYLCYRACQYYRDKLTLRECRNLLIAAIFHDFDHTGKIGPDIVNIGKAIAGLVVNLLPEDKPHLQDIIEIMQATEYPYEEGSSEKLSLVCQIIRDADQSQSFSMAWIQQVIFGLSQEWDSPEKNVTPLQVLKMQAPFHQKLSFITDWAKNEFPQELIDAKIEESLDLVSILT